MKHIRLGIQDSGFGCYRNLPMIDAAQSSALGDTMRWCQKNSMMMPWLSALAAHLLQDTIRPFVTKHRLWKLPVVQTPSSYETWVSLSWNSKQISMATSNTFARGHTSVAKPFIPNTRWFAPQIKLKLKSTFIAAYPRTGKSHLQLCVANISNFTVNILFNLTRRK